MSVNPLRNRITPVLYCTNIKQNDTGHFNPSVTSVYIQEHS